MNKSMYLIFVIDLIMTDLNYMYCIERLIILLAKMIEKHNFEIFYEY